MLKTMVSLALIGLVVGVGALAASFMARTAPAVTEKAVGLPPPLVQTVLVLPQTITETIVGYGSARASRAALLSAEVGGEIVELTPGLRDGSPVRAGQTLVWIDDRRYVQTVEQKLAQAQADRAKLSQLEVTEANLRRLLAIAQREVKVNHDEERRLADLFEQELASRKEYDFARLAHQRALRESTGYQNQLDLIEPQREQLQASLQGRLAEVEVAKLDVEHCRVSAPFDGRIGELLVEIGERVQRGSPIAVVIDPLGVEVPVQLPIGAYPRVNIGTPVELRVDSMPHLRWSGIVERISPDADEQSRTFRAYVEVDNRAQEKPLMPGCFLRAEVTGPTLRDVLLVPRGAIVGRHLFVAGDKRAHRRRVEVERFLGERAVVTGELEPGEAVIVTNLDQIEEGTVVRVKGTDLARGRTE